MKNIIIMDVYVVGRHHWGSNQLEIIALYYCARKTNNPKDEHAIAVHSDQSLEHKVCYLRREDAKKMLVFSLLFVERATYVLKWHQKSTLVSRGHFKTVA